MPWLDEYTPDIDDSIAFYWVAWNALHVGRQRSMGGPSGITFTEMRAFMDEYGVRARDERDRFIALVSRIDARYRQRVSEEAEARLNRGKHGG